MSTGSLEFPSQDPQPFTTMQKVAPRFVGKEAWQEAVRPFLQNLREVDRRGLLAFSDLGCAGMAWATGGALLGVSIVEGVALLWGALLIGCLYSMDQYSLEPQNERHIANACLISSGGTAAVAWSIGQTQLLWVGMATGLLGVLYLVASRRLLAWLLSSRATRRRALLLCDGPEAEEVLRELRRHPLSGIRVLGLVGEVNQGGDAPMSVLGTPGQLPQLTQAWRADSIVAGPSAVRKTEWRQQLAQGEETVDFPGLFERLSYRIPVRYVDERWFIEQFSWNRGIAYQLTKRAVDVCFSLFGILVSLPFLPLLAIANLLDDRGPLFYSQERVGLHGKTFKVYKLRTMRVDAEKHGAVWAQTNDPRVTRLGGFLRLSRLDEIPQLWNVLKGEMSLVGPRPERPEFVRQLEAQIPYYQHRHLVPPGVTGWAQVRFPYGSSVQDSEEKLKFDLYYAKHRSVLFDFLILLRTVSVVINKTGSR